MCCTGWLINKTLLYSTRASTCQGNSPVRGNVCKAFSLRRRCWTKWSGWGVGCVASVTLTSSISFNATAWLHLISLAYARQLPLKGKPLVGYIKVYINSNYHQYLNIILFCGMSQAPYPTNAINYVVYLNINAISSVGFGGFRRTEKFAVIAVVKCFIWHNLNVSAF